MRSVEVKTADGKVRTIDAEPGDEEHAMQRIADLYRTDVIAWREVRTYVGPVHYSQIVG